MTVRTAVDDPPLGRCECWCCGGIQDPGQPVHLGNHAEVTVCVRCAHILSKRASEIEDLARTGAAVRARDALRRGRDLAVHRGWHQRRVLGPPLRWLGKHTP